MMLAALVLALSPWGHAATMPVAARGHADGAAELRGIADDERRDATTDDRGDDDDGDGEPEDGEPDEPASDEERLAEAGAAFTRGVEAYKQERYKDAVVYFNRAQQLAPHPDTLYNLGLAQQRSDDHVGAIATFETLLEQTTDAGEREDIVAAQAVSRGQVAVLRVRSDASPVCLDGEPMVMRDGVRSSLTTPGAHRLDIGEQRRTLELQGGEIRTIELPPDDSSGLPRRGRLALAGIGIAGAGAAAGLGLGAGLVRPPRLQMGLGIGAAAAGTVALTSTVVALVLHRRSRKRRAAATPTRCPSR